MIQIILALSLVVAIGGYVWRAESIKAEYKSFVNEQKRLGEAAVKKVKEDTEKQVKITQEKRDELKKERDKLALDLGSARQRLHDERARSRAADAVPRGAAGDKGYVCYARTEFVGALRELDAATERNEEEILGLIAEGDRARSDARFCAAWVSEQAKVMPR